ncbi:MAG: Gfo/Idh/MocA family oxidoreductase [Planctomycetes bacterium]|nr:Gfo/Idh/MocA family oxidoreductase [Planctomycetota bacterium]
MSDQASRRDFLKNSTTAVAAGSLAATLGANRAVHASGSDILKVGLIGCGGRGSGAAVNAMRAEDNLQLTALADAFPDRLDHCKNILSRQIGKKYQVTDDNCFVGFDAYKQVMESDVDVVCLCTPPHFRPMQIRAAIEAGKHVFCEKPVAVDPTGVRHVLETVKMAKEKNLTIVSGLCWRYDHGVRATMQQIKEENAIGDIVAIQENYLTGTLWHRGRNEDWSEMEYQMRNWLYFTWLSGDHIVEQHIHSLDKSLWLNDDIPPVSATGLGGRQVRTEDKWGHIYDHFAVCYEWANGVKTYSYTRQMSGCKNDVEDYVLGTKGRAKVLKNSIEGENEWKYKGDKPSMYDVEHKELFAGIRSGNIINNGEYMCYSTLLAIMGREVCYTGKTITWEEAMNSQQNLTPEAYEWGDISVPEIAVPGTTKFA